MFVETQRFRQPWILGVLALCAAGVVPFAWGMYQQIVLHRPFGDRPMPDNALIITTVLVTALTAAIIWLLAAAYLLVEIQDDALFFRFFPFLRRSISYGDLRRAEARTYSPIGEYGGWGVRFGRNGKAYNVSGNRGVQLELASGERLLIGSQRADELAAAIQAKMHG